ncbi:MAG: flagellar biosynthesis protein FlhF [Desulfobulbaceae bacterium]|nr:flagellar biosynthesis protein FlhF [Desulfobulbaceae bacterium]
MKIKKYVAENLREGKNKIVADLGDDAIILSSRVIQDPVSGKEFVEIVAALDESSIKTEPNKSYVQINKGISKSTDSNPSAKSFRPPIQNDKTKDSYNRQFDEIKEMLAKLNDNIKVEKLVSNDNIINELYRKMLESDFNESTSKAILAAMNEFKNYNDVNEALIEARKIISSGIIVHPPLNKSNISQTCIFLGPTGSGKTSTLVKLSLIAKLIYKADVMIISTDTYKVGGAEQLETLASIASIHYKTVYTAADLKELIIQESKRDFIFVDTAGKNFKDKAHIESLREFIAAGKFSQIYLVLSGNHSSKFYESAYESFGKLTPSSLIITKIDESDSLGSLYSILNENMLPISYITTGQQIPDDIEPADKLLLTKLILPD